MRLTFSINKTEKQVARVHPNFYFKANLDNEILEKVRTCHVAPASGFKARGRNSLKVASLNLASWRERHHIAHLRKFPFSSVERVFWTINLCVLLIALLQLEI